MRWFRRPASRDAADAEIDRGLDEVAEVLRASAREAPMPDRAEEIRAAVLDEVEADPRVVPGLVPLAIVAAVLLVALAVGVGGPAVGSFIENLLDDPPAPSLPAVDDTPSRVAPVDGPGRSELIDPSRFAPSQAADPPAANDSGVRTNGVGTRTGDPAAPAASSGPIVVIPTPAVAPTPSPTPDDTFRPGQPWPVPTPPAPVPPIPTPPAPAP